MATGASTEIARAAQVSLLTRLIYSLKLRTIQVLAVTAKNITTFLSRNSRPNYNPTLIQSYPVRAKFKNRVFIPPTHKAGTKLPLFISLHGGGFALCNPSFDDEWNSHMSTTYGILIVSLDYSKAPQYRFPIPIDDIVALVTSVLEDPSLPIDKSRVAIGGFSAGGNLALAVAQAESLKGKIHAVVPIYPVLDFITPSEAKAKNRPYREGEGADTLLSLSTMFNWGYIPAGHDLRDPKLSVRFAKRESLPSRIFMVGAEYDMLSGEARDMIMDIAGLEGAQEREKGKYEFVKGTYRWLLVRGVEHGYTQSMGPASEGEKAKEGREVTYKAVSEWLFEGAFAEKNKN